MKLRQKYEIWTLGRYVLNTTHRVSKQPFRLIDFKRSVLLAYLLDYIVNAFLEMFFFLWLKASDLQMSLNVISIMGLFGW